jgi:glycosyltransferase involved in cell wall biosynthesis
VIVYDDASSDATPDVMQAYRGDSRFRYFRQPRNVGVAANRNSCLGVARGDYIAWLDSDDVYMPEMLDTQAGALDRLPDVGLVHGAFRVVDADGTGLPDWRLPFEHDHVESGTEAFGELILENYIAAPTVLVRRACHELVGPYPEGRGTASSTDWEMWLRVALIADLAYTSRVVAAYRQHGDSISSQTTASGERLRCDAGVIRRIFSSSLRVPERERLESRARAALAARSVLAATDAFGSGERRRALEALATGVRASPRQLIDPSVWQLALSIARRDELSAYRSSKRLLRRLHDSVAPSRFAERIRKFAVTDDAWEDMARRTAQTIERMTPPAARVAVVDKHDPTILALSDRRGWHFPDRLLQPDGYPRDSKRAVTHVEELLERGATHLVFPSASFWWLDFYGGLREYLESTHQPVCREDHCLVYELGARKERQA